MKKIFVAVLAMAGVVACNTVDTLDVPQNPEIRFANAFVENATRANEALDPSTTTESLTAFDVWGFMHDVTGTVFVGEDVTGSKGNFTYTNTQYWVPGHTYYFAAVAPMNSTNVEVDTATADLTGIGTIKFTNKNGTEDLLYSAVAVDAPAMGEAKTVMLTFNHLLSKVKFTFTNGFANDNAKIVVTNIHIADAPKTATATLTGNWWEANPWKGYEGTTDLAFGDAGEILRGAKQQSADERLTLPAPATQVYNISFDVELFLGEVSAYKGSKTAVVKDIELEIGKAYNFAATIDQTNITEDGSELQPIVFDVEVVKDWVDADKEGNVVLTEAVSTEQELIEALSFGGVVTLANDIELTKSLNVALDTVLDLNGHTLKNKVENTATDVIVVAEGATLTINGEGDSTIEAVTGNDGYAVISEGTVVINGGTFKAGVDANGAANAVVYARKNGKVYVNGGNFPNESNSTFVLNKKDADRATTTIEVRGGQFTAFDPANNAAEGANTNFCALGYVSTANGNVYTVAAAALKPAAGVNDYAGATLAIAAAPADNGLVRPEAGDVPIKNLTIDGGNYSTINGNGLRGIYINTNGTYTLENVVIKNVTYAINVGAENGATTATLNVIDSTLEGWTSFNGATTATFTNVKFECGKYANFKPYTSTTLTNCSFEDGFMIDFTSLSGVITLKNCTYNGTVLTAENFANIVVIDGDHTGKIAF